MMGANPQQLNKARSHSKKAYNFKVRWTREYSDLAGSIERLVIAEGRSYGFSSVVVVCYF
jgi:hypothetical protein